MDRIIADLDGQFPGIASAVVQREMSTAGTFHHYLNTPGGAIYGFAPQTRGFMPRPETAVDGLYLASAFTGGGGFTGAILGGGLGSTCGDQGGCAASRALVCCGIGIKASRSERLSRNG